MALETANFLKLKDTADLDFQDVLAEIGESITILNQTMSCIPAEISIEEQFVGGGYYDAQDVVVTVRQKDFSTTPKQMDAVEFRGRDLRIKKVSEGFVTYNLTLGDRNS